VPEIMSISEVIAKLPRVGVFVVHRIIGESEPPSKRRVN
jgi:hypothetical protein